MPKKKIETPSESVDKVLDVVVQSSKLFSQLPYTMVKSLPEKMQKAIDNIGNGLILLHSDLGKLGAGDQSAKRKSSGRMTTRKTVTNGKASMQAVDQELETEDHE